MIGDPRSGGSLLATNGNYIEAGGFLSWAPETANLPLTGYQGVGVFPEEETLYLGGFTLKIMVGA